MVIWSRRRAFPPCCKKLGGNGFHLKHLNFWCSSPHYFLSSYAPLTLLSTIFLFTIKDNSKKLAECTLAWNAANLCISCFWKDSTTLGYGLHIFALLKCITGQYKIQRHVFCPFTCNFFKGSSLWHEATLLLSEGVQISLSIYMI